MSLRKRRPVLYELVRRSRSAEFGRKERSAPHRPEAAPAPRPSLSVAEPPPPPPEAPEPTRVVRATSERLQLTLNWPTVAVLLAALVVVLVVSFHAGRRYEQRPTVAGGGAPSLTDAGEPLDAARSPSAADTAPNALAPGDANVSRAPSPEPPPTNATLKPGHHYVFIQFFPKSKMGDARAAEAFLRQNGLPCVIQRAKNDIRLVATEAFLLSHKDAAARQREKQRCDQLQQRIKQLGKEYARAGGGYVFDQCDPRKIGE